MNKLIFASLISAICVPALAQDRGLNSIDGYELAIQASSYLYEEPGVMNNTGNKLGLEFTATNTFPNKWFASTSVRYAQGKVDYTGSGTLANKTDKLSELRIIAGKDHSFTASTLSPYFGVGYRFLYNDLRGTSSTDALGYQRESRYLYVPLGVHHRFRAGIQSRITTTLEYDLFLRGDQKSYLSDLGLNIDPINKQNNGYGYRLSTTYEQKTWGVGLFYSYWNIDQSVINYYTDGVDIIGIYEPDNFTREAGIKYSFRF